MNDTRDRYSILEDDSIESEAGAVCMDGVLAQLDLDKTRREEGECPPRARTGRSNGLLSELRYY